MTLLTLFSLSYNSRITTVKACDEVSEFLKVQLTSELQLKETNIKSAVRKQSILDFKQVWSFFFKPRRISGSADQPCQTRYRFLPDF
jgi:hypothetical protein